MKFDILSFVGKHSKTTLACIAIVTIFFLYHAVSLELSGDYSDLLYQLEDTKVFEGGTGQADPTTQQSESKNLILDTQVLNASPNLRASTDPSLASGENEEDYPYTTSYLVMVEAENLYTAENLTLIEKTMTELSSTKELSESSSVLTFVTLEKRGTRLMSVPFAPNQGRPLWTDEEAALLKSRVEQDPIIKNYLVSEDMTGMLFSFETSAFSDTRELELAAMLTSLHDAGIKTYINGGSVISNRLMHYLGRDLKALLGLCALAILLVYYLSFKAKRSMLLPFSMSVIGIIWTFGTMKLLGYALTVVNIVTPCMVLNLGSSYAIHVIGEYYADYSSGATPIESTKKILRTIAFACLTTVIGFLSLLFSKTPALREFGIAVSVGITFCAVLSATYLPALLTLVSPPKPLQLKTYSTGYLARIVDYSSKIVLRRWPIFVLVWLVVIAGFFLTKDQVRINTNYMSYLPEKDSFGKESRHFAQKMGGDAPFVITIEAPDDEKNFFLQSENLAKVYDYEQAVLEKSDDVIQILSFASYVSFANAVYSGEEGIPSSSGLLNLLSRMVILMNNQSKADIGAILNEDGSSLSLFIQNYDAKDKDLMTVASAARVEQVLQANLPLLPNGTKILIRGEPHASLRFSNLLLSDQKKSTYISFVLVFLVVLLAFLSLSQALFALIPILTGVMANYIFMYLLGIPFDMITVTFASVAVGAGIDDAIHFLLRYKNNLRDLDLPLIQVVETTIKETGRPIILTTLSIIAGMLMFLFASYTPVRYFGSLMSIALLNCMLSTIFIMPSYIILTAKVRSKLKKKTAIYV
ncbi:MAG TPA: efflux RND transporter permease subunit [Sphaerochaeta sp.]|nr:efflux RND transporter permease subunit [Sphaerochaeta sp.]